VTPTLYFNPACSKCRTAEGLLRDRGIEVSEVRYLERPPTVEELRHLMTLLGIDDPQLMVRSGEPVYSDLALGQASPDRLIAAIVEHPVLLQRPIFVVGDRAVIARPPEKVLELL
jgi:arsenate reductase